jgi:zinc transport system substrate-binding protein
MKNRYLAAAGIILVAIIAASGLYLFNGNSSNRATTSGTAGQGKLKVLATFFPVYDFTRNVGGDKIDLSLLVPETVDVHAFEPTPSAIQEVASANVLIYSGAGLEPWIPQVITAAGNPNLVVVDSSAGIPLLPVPSQFQKKNRMIDPHIWLDPVLAKIQVANILHGLAQADPADAQYFTANAEAYEAKLDFLNSEIVNATADVKTRYFVTFHEAFAYFAKEYNLTQIPIAGPFEEEPTPSDIQTVINAVRLHGLCYVGYESLENPAISQSIAGQTKATLVLMDPIEGLTQADHVAGKTYLIKMQENLQIFTLVLNHVGC